MATVTSTLSIPTGPVSITPIKKKRKQRTIKNGLVCLDDVKSAPGDNYINWIPSVKDKLKEREVKLLRERMRILQSVIEMSLEQFAHQNRAYFFEFRRSRTIQVSRMATVNHSVYRAVVTTQAMQSVIAECTCFINATLAKWNGVKESKRLKTQILEFRKYFAVSKNWFDQIKLEHMALHFWMPIFNLVETMAGKAAGEFFSQRLYAHQALYGRYLNMLILENLLRGTLKIANSRERLLIPAGAFRTLKKNVPLFKPRPLPLSPTGRRKKSKKATSKETREQILQCVVLTASASKREFQEALFALHEEVDHYQPKHVTLQASPMAMAMHTLQAPVMAHPSCCSLKMCNRDIDELDFGDVGMADVSMASPSVSVPSYSMDAPSPQPQRTRCNQNIPMSIDHSMDAPSLSPLTQRSTRNIPLPQVKDLYIPCTFSKSLSNPMADLYQKPEMMEIPQIPEMYGRSGLNQNKLRQTQKTHPAWQQPLSGNNSAYNPFSSNNSYNAYNSSSASAYQSNYSR